MVCLTHRKGSVRLSLTSAMTALNVVPLARLAALLLVTVACTPPTPQTGCRFDSECASGRCLAGVCTEPDTNVTSDVPDETAGQTDGGGDTSDVDADAVETREDTLDVSNDGAVGTCATDLDCEAWMPTHGPCLVAHCNSGKCVALPIADATTCATVTLCPEPGFCQSGTCKAVGKPCDDGEACTVDVCDLASGCTHTAKPDGVGGCDSDSECTVGACSAGVCNPSVVASGTCRINGVCYDGGASKFNQPCARCLPESAKTEFTLLETGPCDDGDACTQGEVCNGQGVCGGVNVVCTDDNPCTDNTCDAKTGCVTTPNAVACDDGNPCSLTESCVSGACLPATWNTCDDGNACTTDLCDGDLGCVHTPASGPCQFDADPCTTDACVGGACSGVPLESVCTIGGACVPAGTSADGQPCLICDPDQAADDWTPVNNKECDDGNACTAGDMCYSGACIGAVGLCDDKNPCTKNNCTPQSGCVFLPANVACDDGNECTSGDDCSTGKCVGIAMAASACNDDNPCTDDSCLPVAGCAHAPNLLGCNDGDPCTAGDFCTAGVCHAAHVICACSKNSDCDDANPCTVDGCDAMGECINTPIAAGLCDDGNACTNDDHCAKGYCLGVTISCNDGEACSADGCVPTTGCVFLALQGATCNDGNACTTGDLCVNGACTGTPKNCDDGKACTADACKATTGKCDHISLAEGTTCTADGSSCTIDACVAGECNHTAIVPGLCQIAGVCMDAGTGQLGGQCLGCVPSVSQTKWSVMKDATCSDGNACTGEDTCLADGTCLGAPIACDDGNPCTLDVCNPLASFSSKGPCLFAPSAAVCDDGDPCTTADICQAAKCTGSALVCDDGNACTLDACVPLVGCKSTAGTTNSACGNDGFACTIDVCAGATCTHPIAPGGCLIDGACRAAGQSSVSDPCARCLPAIQADGWSPASGGACDDGDPCTSGDFCDVGTCAGLVIAPCDDGDACTADSCTAKVGCTHAPLSGTPCQDGNLCTSNDTCAVGVCKPGIPTVCVPPAATSCGLSVCEPNLGCHFISKCNSLEGCFEGACATLDAANLPAPVTVPLDNAVAPQPLAPTLAWQLSSGSDGFGLPHLQLAVQTRGCAPQVGLYSSVVAATLPVNQLPLVWQVAPSSAPTGAAGWCGLNPQFVRPSAPSTNLLLAWNAGGNTASTCDVLATGGATQLAEVIGSAGALATLVQSACPAAIGTLARPAMAFGQTPTTDLVGLLARATQSGVRVWQGAAGVTWGAAGEPVLPGDVPGTTAQLLSQRPVLVQPADAEALLITLSKHVGGLEPLYTVDVSAVSENANTPFQTSSKLAGIDNTSSNVVYRGLDAAWDPDTQTVAVLISGTLQFAGTQMGFLALARTSLGTPLTTPTLLRLFAQPVGTSAEPVLHAFRLAEIPGSPDFLLAFGATDATTLELLRVQPQTDTQFTVKFGKILTTDFVGHETGDAILSFGGLSELAIAPDGSAVSIVYETVGAVRLVSVPMP